MTTPDSLKEFKASQREGWALFAPLESITTQPAGLLVEFAKVNSGAAVLDVGCGTGVVSITASRRGAQVQGLDLSPVLVERARQNAALAKCEIRFQEGDAEELPYKENEFDFVLSQFGHMFAPRPEVAVSEMLRVLKPGGVIAFSTWPPELYTGRMFALVSKYLPPPPGVAPPPLWGEPSVIRERLGEKVKDIVFDRQVMYSPALSVPHLIEKFETTAGPLTKLKAKLEKEDPRALDSFRTEFAELIGKYLHLNSLHQHFLMTRAVKK